MTQSLIIFVCTGNLCRSPMAEVILKDRLGPNSRWRVESAGTIAMRGAPASREGQAAVKERGVDLTRHRSQPVTEDLVDAAEVIVVMSATHRDQLRMQFPGCGHKVHLLKSFDVEARSRDLEDPIGLPLAAYRETRNQIEKALPGLLEYLGEKKLSGDS